MKLILIKSITTHNIYKDQQKKGHQALSIKTHPIIFSQENSKLRFEMLEMNSASQNHLPCRGWKTPPKSAFY
jgi:hypothetical protein